MSATDVLRVALIVSPILLLVAWGVARLRRARLEVRAAIEREGYQIVRMEYRLFRQGPLFWTTTRSQAVYHVVARDASGREHTAWARWGRTWLFAPDALELRWER